MATFNFLNKNIHYQVEGSGEPLLLLNGIMMSMASWNNIIDPLKENFTVIRVDFFDQGLTDTYESSYTQALQVDLLKALLDHLNLDKVNVVGISYGGEVALKFSITHPNLVSKLIVFNAVSHTDKTLKELGHKWNEYALKKDSYNYYLETIPVIYSKTFKETNKEWMDNREKLLLEGPFSNEEFLNKMIRLTNSSENFDVRNKLDNLTMPVLIIGAEEDFLTPVSAQKELKDNIKNSHLVILPEVGHASIYENPVVFNALIIGFIKTNQFDYKI